MWNKFIIVTLIVSCSEDSYQKDLTYLADDLYYNNYNDLDEHATVIDNTVFPFIVAVLFRNSYVSAGALISENWVITCAESLKSLKESLRLLRVRLGSNNFKEGGVLLPIKLCQIHPDFDNKRPIYDIALLKLSAPVEFSPTLKAIPLQKEYQYVEASHFVVPSWSNSVKCSGETTHATSMEIIKKNRLLSVTYLHPAYPEDCAEELSSVGVNSTDDVMCLDTGIINDPCSKDLGAPVVLNDVIWGIVSSWTPTNCEDGLGGTSFVNLVAAPNISKWIHDTVENGVMTY